MRSLILASSLAVALAACAPLPSPDRPYTGPFADLNETFWRPAPASTAIPALTEIRFSENKLIEANWCLQTSLVFDAAPSAGVRFRSPYPTNYGPSCDPARSPPDPFELRLRETASYRQTGNRLVLLDAGGNELVTLERITDLGFEYRELRVVSFRAHRRLVSAHAQGDIPFLRLFDGRFDGTPGCGGIFGDYTKPKPNTINLAASWIIMGPCDESLGRERLYHALFDDLNGEHAVEARGDGSFALRDADGTVRAVLAPRTR